MIDFDTFTKIAENNVGDLGKLIVAKGFKKLPKVQKCPIWSHWGWHSNRDYFESKMAEHFKLKLSLVWLDLKLNILYTLKSWFPLND